MGTGKSKKIKKAVHFINFLKIIMLLSVATAALYVAAIAIKNRMEERTTGDVFSRENRAGTEMVMPVMTLSAEAREQIAKTDVNNEEAILDVYKGMKETNDEFTGFLTIEGTKINYPVMYSKDEPEKYLTRDINGEECVSGLPFIDTRCSIDPESDNIIIYGHNMKDGSMFGQLDSYKSEDYFREHPIIHFDSPEGLREYEVMAAFYDRVYYKDEDDYRFYDFIDAADEDDFKENVNKYIKKSIYDTGVRAEHGDKLITLVTCTYQTENGRFAVTAKRKK